MERVGIINGDPDPSSVISTGSVTGIVEIDGGQEAGGQEEEEEGQSLLRPAAAAVTTTTTRTTMVSIPRDADTTTAAVTATIRMDGARRNRATVVFAYGLPSSAMGQRLVDAIRQAVSRLLTFTDAVATAATTAAAALPTPSWQPRLSEFLHELTKEMNRMPSASSSSSPSDHGCYYSPSFQSILKLVLAFLEHLHKIFVRNSGECCMSSNRRAITKSLRSEISKLPGYLLIFQQAVDVVLLLESDAARTKHPDYFPPEHCPFPSPDSEDADASMREWESMVQSFDASPFFQSPGHHLSKKLRLFNKLLVQSTAAASRTYKMRNPMLRMISFGFWNSVYALAQHDAAVRCSESFRNLDTRMVKLLWNLMDTDGIRGVVSGLMYDDVFVDQAFSIFVPVEPIERSDLSAEEAAKLPQYRIKIPTLPVSYLDEVSCIRLRLISNGILPFVPFMEDHDNSKRRRSRGCCGCCLRDPMEEVSRERMTGGLYGNFYVDYPLLPVPSKGLVIHFHGGGFVSMTSYSHMAYTRRWATDTGVPIVSVDYRLAPEWSYPVQLSECYRAYKWMIANSLLLGSSAERVILVGDSAGGNLVVGVVIRAIVEGFRVPDGIVLAYPALYLLKHPCCSRLLSSIDPMLNSLLLLHLFDIFVKESDENETNPFLSPLTAPDDILRQFPPTRMLVGEFDPLLDDSVCFYQRLVSLGKADTTMITIRGGVGHGFLNMVGFLPEANRSVGLIAVWLMELLFQAPPGAL